jgi:hypothetical protein
LDSKINIIKIRDVIISIGFVLLVIFPAMQSIYPVVPEVENTENRKLADEPVFDINRLDPFPAQYEKYFNDHFSLRNQFIKLKSKLIINALQKSPMPDKVIFGKDGWMFLVKNELAEYRGTNIMKQVDIEKVVKEFLRREAYLNKRNTKLYIAIAPIKYSIYPEFLPSYVDKVNRKTRTDLIVKELNDSGLNVLDLRPVLLKEKKNGLLYYKTDNHWNSLGGFYAYKALINRIKLDFPSIPVLSLQDFNIKTDVTNGRNLAKMLNMIDDFTDTEYVFEQKFPTKAKKVKKVGYPVPKSFPYKWEFETEFETGNDTLPNLLFIRDSFGKAIMPYIDQSFNRSVFIFDAWKYRSDENIVENENPDVVVYLILESLWGGVLKGVDMSPVSSFKKNKK